MSTRRRLNHRLVTIKLIVGISQPKGRRISNLDPDGCIMLQQFGTRYGENVFHGDNLLARDFLNRNNRKNAFKLKMMVSINGQTLGLR